ncbi:MAG: LysM peptidoglycan-binding domain-containing protein [Bacteroidales bacterium]|nr:LysM peptidoglycan-binding domain-containing protein [Bacteroidales bacterium]
MTKHCCSLLLLTVLCLFPHIGNAQSNSVADSLFSKQLKNISSGIPLTYHSALNAYIYAYTNDKKGSSCTLGAFFFYAPFIDSLLNSKNLPAEFKYLPLALSRMDAWHCGDWNRKGYWSLPYLTAIRYGLTVNDSIDERHDIRKSSIAAIRCLQHMYESDNNIWNVIIAYANSWQQLHQARAITSDSAQIWDIYSSSALDNKAIIPQWIAAVYISHYYSFHNIFPLSPLHPCEETVPLKYPCSRSHFCECLGLSPAQFRTLNPCMVNDYIPTCYPLHLSCDKADLFYAKGDSIYLLSGDTMLLSDTAMISDTSKVENALADNTTTIKPVNNSKNSTPIQAQSFTYTIQSGDVLGTIAKKYNTTVSNIKNWNHLKNDKIYAGQKLTIYLNAKSDSHHATHTYTVKKGDTLTSIARKHNTTVEKLKQLNRLTGDRIDIGQKLLIQ